MDCMGHTKVAGPNLNHDRFSEHQGASPQSDYSQTTLTNVTTYWLTCPMTNWPLKLYWSDYQPTLCSGLQSRVAICVPPMMCHVFVKEIKASQTKQIFPSSFLAHVVSKKNTESQLNFSNGQIDKVKYKSKKEKKPCTMLTKPLE